MNSIQLNETTYQYMSDIQNEKNNNNNNVKKSVSSSDTHYSSFSSSVESESVKVYHASKESKLTIPDIIGIVDSTENKKHQFILNKILRK